MGMSVARQIVNNQKKLGAEKAINTNMDKCVESLEIKKMTRFVEFKWNVLWGEWSEHDVS